MSNAPGAQQNPMYCMIAGKLNVSFDNGTTWNPISSGTGFTSDVIIQLPNSNSTPVTALELKTTLPTNTAGSETSAFDMTTLVGGSPVLQHLAKINGAGAQAVTTSGSTPTVAWASNSDLLEITLGADVTTVTVTGLNDAIDVCYEVGGHILNGAAQVKLEPNGVAGANTLGLFIQRSDASLHGSTTSGFMWIDSDTASAKGTTRATLTATSVGRSFNVFMSVPSFTEWYQAIDSTTAGTTPMTSLVFAGAMKATSVIYLIRGRITSA